MVDTSDFDSEDDRFEFYRGIYFFQIGNGEWRSALRVL